MAPGVLSGAILSWITCINELSSSVMLYGGKTSTISVAIYTEAVSYTHLDVYKRQVFYSCRMKKGFMREPGAEKGEKRGTSH